MISRILALLIKEFFAVWRDKRSRMILIVPPIVQILIFSQAVTLDVKNVSIGILNLDNGKASIELLHRFKGAPVFSTIRYMESVKDVETAIDNQEVIMVIHIDESFSRKLYGKLPASVQLIFDGRKSNTAQIVQGYALRIIQQFNQEFFADLNFPMQPTVLVTRNWYNPNLIYTWFSVPNLCGVLTMLVSLIITALSVARERELGTFDQLLVSPIQPLEILIGKTIPAILISMAEGSLIIAAALLVFRIPFTGSIFLLYASMFVFVSSIVGVGLFISSLCMTQQQAILGSFFFMGPAILISGFATPVEAMPNWLQTISLLNPLRHFLVVIKGIFLKDMPAWQVFSNTWPLALIALFNLSAADWFFRKRLE
jgi:ABC-2 type transport system permease protein